MERNEFLKAICHNYDELINQIQHLTVKEKFVIIKENNEPVILIGTEGRKHGRIILEYLDQTKNESVVVAGGGYCGLEGDIFVFYGSSGNFKTARNIDIKKVLSSDKEVLKIEYKCLNDNTKDVSYTLERIRKIAL